MTDLSDIQFTDRYDGIGRPHRWRYCRGDCEAVGVVPVKLGATEGEGDAELLRRAWAQHNEGGGHDPDGTCEGWHFVTCPACEGSRVAPWPTALRRLPALVARDARFVWREGIRQHTRPPHWTRRRQLALVLRIAAGRVK